MAGSPHYKVYSTCARCTKETARRGKDRAADPRPKLAYRRSKQLRVEEFERCSECDAKAITEGPWGEPYCCRHAKMFGAPLDATDDSDDD
jgi:hypothetical protein